MHCVRSTSYLAREVQSVSFQIRRAIGVVMTDAARPRKLHFERRAQSTEQKTKAIAAIARVKEPAGFGHSRVLLSSGQHRSSSHALQSGRSPAKSRRSLYNVAFSGQPMTGCGRCSRAMLFQENTLPMHFI